MRPREVAATHTPIPITQEEDQKRTSTDKPSPPADARISQITDEAIEAYNRLLAGPLSLPKAQPVGMD